ncbi:MAG: TraR/DksA family transcriptional regulator [Myxococcales bacterium]
MEKSEAPDSFRAKQALLARRRLLGGRYSEHEEHVTEPPPVRDDAAEEFMTRAVDYALSEQEREEIVEIDRALSRIDHGRWGTCEVCGQEIDADRLVALPEARDCLRCAVRREHGLS